MNELYLKATVVVLGIIALTLNWIVSNQHKQVMDDLYQRFG